MIDNIDKLKCLENILKEVLKREEEITRKTRYLRKDVLSFNLKQ